MKTNTMMVAGLFLLILLTGCGISDYGTDGVGGTSSIPGDSEGGSGSNEEIQPGVITAAEWCDLDHWDFWSDLMQDQEFDNIRTDWSCFNDRRIAVEIRDAEENLLPNVQVDLVANDETIWRAKTDNSGQAELWIDPFNAVSDLDTVQFELLIENETTVDSVLRFEEGLNLVTLQEAPAFEDRAEIAFVVDATGSMGDELEYLKVELEDVLSRINEEHPTAELYTSAVYYRDQGDQFITRISNFTPTVSTTLDFISEQTAGGGGDYAEAVHTALDVAVTNLQWSPSSKARVLFLMLDAPPHQQQDVISSLHESVETAAAKGIRMVPIIASGADLTTEYLMRHSAISTNGTFVFITDDSGVGNEHHEPRVGEVQIEHLNDLIVRVVGEYID